MALKERTDVGAVARGMARVAMRKDMICCLVGWLLE
jgi:hypothetical protein